MSRRPSGGEKTAQDRGAAHNVSSGRCASLVSATRDLVVVVMVVSDLSHNNVLGTDGVGQLELTS